jgi:uroporphyrinogen-III decarboxylase
MKSKEIIDEYIAAVRQTEEEVLESKTYSHVEILSKRYGKEVFITMNEGNPFADVLDPHGLLGFEDGLIALLEESEMIAYLLYQLYDIRLEKMKALYKCGADGYIGSETYCSADLISPSTYRDIVLPAQQHFYRELKKIGLYSICYFTGNLFPMLEDIKEIGIDALLTESRNKGIEIDISRLYDQVDGDFTLYGNLNSVDILQRGSAEEVHRETLRQIRLCSRGKFIMSNDCPIPFGTPEENIRTMLETSREAQESA